MEKKFLGQQEKFVVDRKQVRLWSQKEDKITKQKSRSKEDGRGCNARYPSMEDKVNKEFLDLRKEGRKVKRSRFDTRFCKRKNISLRKTTYAAQHASVNLSVTISKFHAKLLRVQRRGNFQLCDIVNMDQTPLPFVLMVRHTIMLDQNKFGLQVQLQVYTSVSAQFN